MGKWWQHTAHKWRNVRLWVSGTAQSKPVFTGFPDAGKNRNHTSVRSTQPAPATARKKQKGKYNRNNPTNSMWEPDNRHTICKSLAIVKVQMGGRACVSECALGRARLEAINAHKMSDAVALSAIRMAFKWRAVYSIISAETDLSFPVLVGFRRVPACVRACVCF